MVEDQESYISESGSETEKTTGYGPQGLTSAQLCDDDADSMASDGNAVPVKPTNGSGSSKTKIQIRKQSENDRIVKAYQGTIKRPEFDQKLPNGYDEWERWLPKLEAHCAKALINLDLLRGVETDPSSLSDDQLEIIMLDASKDTVEHCSLKLEQSEHVLQKRFDAAVAAGLVDATKESRQSMEHALCKEVEIAGLTLLNFFRRKLKREMEAQSVLLFRDLQKAAVLTGRSQTIQRVAKHKLKHGENGIQLLHNWELESLGLSSMDSVITALKAKLKAVRKTSLSSFDKSDGWLDKYTDVCCKLVAAGSKQHDLEASENHQYHIKKINKELISHSEWEPFCTETYNLQAKIVTDTCEANRQFGESWSHFRLRQKAFADMLKDKSASSGKTSKNTHLAQATITPEQFEQMAAKAGFVKKQQNGPQPKRVPKKGTGQISKPKCTNCGKLGHVAKDCWKDLSPADRDAARQKLFEDKRKSVSTGTKPQLVAQAAVKDPATNPFHLLDLANTSVNSACIMIDAQERSYADTLCQNIPVPPIQVISLSPTQHADMDQNTLIQELLKLPQCTAGDALSGLTLTLTLVDTSGDRCGVIACTLQCAIAVLQVYQSYGCNVYGTYVLNGEDEYVFSTSTWAAPTWSGGGISEQAVVTTQSVVRRFLAQKKVQQVKAELLQYSSAVCIQSATRGLLACKHAFKLKLQAVQSLRTESVLVFPGQAETFVSSKTFQGSHEHLIFTTGKFGTGYYLDFTGPDGTRYSQFGTGMPDRHPNRSQRRRRRMAARRYRIITAAKVVAGRNRRWTSRQAKAAGTAYKNAKVKVVLYNQRIVGDVKCSDCLIRNWRVRHYITHMNDLRDRLSLPYDVPVKLFTVTQFFGDVPREVQDDLLSEWIYVNHSATVLARRIRKWVQNRCVAATTVTAAVKGWCTRRHLLDAREMKAKAVIRKYGRRLIRHKRKCRSARLQHQHIVNCGTRSNVQLQLRIPAWVGEMYRSLRKGLSVNSATQSLSQWPDSSGPVSKHVDQCLAFTSDSDTDTDSSGSHDALGDSLMTLPDTQHVCNMSLYGTHGVLDSGCNGPSDNGLCFFNTFLNLLNKANITWSHAESQCVIWRAHMNNVQLTAHPFRSDIVWNSMVQFVNSIHRTSVTPRWMIVYGELVHAVEREIGHLPDRNSLRWCALAIVSVMERWSQLSVHPHSGKAEQLLGLPQGCSAILNGCVQNNTFSSHGLTQACPGGHILYFKLLLQEVKQQGLGNFQVHVLTPDGLVVIRAGEDSCATSLGSVGMFDSHTWILGTEPLYDLCLASAYADTFGSDPWELCKQFTSPCDLYTMGLAPLKQSQPLLNAMMYSPDVQIHGQSEIRYMPQHGMRGLFATVPIEQGTVICKMKSTRYAAGYRMLPDRLQRAITQHRCKEAVIASPFSVNLYYDQYATTQAGLMKAHWYAMNHSDVDDNVKVCLHWLEVTWVANRDISANEHLTFNYAYVFDNFGGSPTFQNEIQFERFEQSIEVPLGWTPIEAQGGMDDYQFGDQSNLSDQFGGQSNVNVSAQTNTTDNAAWYTDQLQTAVDTGSSQHLFCTVNYDSDTDTEFHRERRDMQAAFKVLIQLGIIEDPATALIVKLESLRKQLKISEVTVDHQYASLIQIQWRIYACRIDTEESYMREEAWKAWDAAILLQTVAKRKRLRRQSRLQCITADWQVTWPLYAEDMDYDCQVFQQDLFGVGIADGDLVVIFCCDNDRKVTSAQVADMQGNMEWVDLPHMDASDSAGGWKYVTDTRYTEQRSRIRYKFLSSAENDIIDSLIVEGLSYFETDDNTDTEDSDLAKLDQSYALDRTFRRWATLNSEITQSSNQADIGGNTTGNQADIGGNTTDLNVPGYSILVQALSVSGYPRYIPSWWPGIDSNSPTWASHRCWHYPRCQNFVSDFAYKLIGLPASSNLLCDFCKVYDDENCPQLEMCEDCDDSILCAVCSQAVMNIKNEVCRRCTDSLVTLAFHGLTRSTPVDESAAATIQYWARQHIERSKRRTCLHRPNCKRTVHRNSQGERSLLCTDCGIYDEATSPFHMCCELCDFRPRSPLQHRTEGAHPQPQYDGWWIDARQTLIRAQESGVSITAQELLSLSSQTIGHVVLDDGKGLCYHRMIEQMFRRAGKKVTITYVLQLIFLDGINRKLSPDNMQRLRRIWEDYTCAARRKEIQQAAPLFCFAVKNISNMSHLDPQDASCVDIMCCAKLLVLTSPLWGPLHNESGGGGHTGLTQMIIDKVSMYMGKHKGLEIALLSSSRYVRLTSGQEPRYFLGTACVSANHCWEFGTEPRLDKLMLDVLQIGWRLSRDGMHEGAVEGKIPFNVQAACANRNIPVFKSENSPMLWSEQSGAVFGMGNSEGKSQMTAKFRQRKATATPQTQVRCRHYPTCRCWTHSNHRAWKCGQTTYLCNSCEEFDLGHDPEHDRCEGCIHVETNSNVCKQCKTRGYCDIHGDLSPDPQMFYSAVVSKSVTCNNQKLTVKYCTGTKRCGVFATESIRAGSCLVTMKDCRTEREPIALPIQLIAALKRETGALPYESVVKITDEREQQLYCYDNQALTWDTLQHSLWFHINSTEPQYINTVCTHIAGELRWIACNDIAQGSQLLQHGRSWSPLVLNNHKSTLNKLSPGPIPYWYNLRDNCNMNASQKSVTMSASNSPKYRASRKGKHHSQMHTMAMCSVIKQPRTGLRCLSLCDGEGGFLVACQLAGVRIEICYTAEITDFGIKTSSTRHRSKCVHVGDLTKITEKMITEEMKPDVIWYGSPCSDVSRARTNGGGVSKGIHGEKSKLFFDCLRVQRWAQRWNPNLLVGSEQVKPAHKTDEDALSNIHGRKPIVSEGHFHTPGRRTRLYWINFRVCTLERPSWVPSLQDILKSGTAVATSAGKAYCILAHPHTQCNKTRVREHNGTVRDFLPSEEATLLGFSEDYHDIPGISREQKHRMCGEGFCVPALAALLGGLKQLSEQTTDTAFKTELLRIFLGESHTAHDGHVATSELGEHRGQTITASALDVKCRESEFWTVSPMQTLRQVRFQSLLVDSDGRLLVMLDSGCSTSLTGNRDWLHNIVQCEIHAHLASGHCTITEKGSCTLTCVTGHRIELPECMYHQSVEHTLLAAAQLAKLGYTFTMGTECTLSARDGSIIPVIMAHGVPWIEIQRTEHSAAVVHNAPAESLQTWHNRLHMPTSRLIELANDPHSGVRIRLSDIRNPPEISCESCRLGTFAQSKVEETPQEIPALGAVVSTDSYVVTTPALISGRTRAGNFVEGKTGYIFFSSLPDPSAKAMGELFLLYKAEVIDPNGLIIIRHHSDQGTEYEAEYKTILRGLGIRATVSVAHCHWQNARAEVRWRLLRNTATAMRNHCGADNRYWELSYVYAAYRLNRTVGKDGKSPYSELFQARNYMGLIRVFGCACTARFPLKTLHGEGHNKLDNQGFSGIFVGMAGEPLTLNQPAYLVYVPNENRIRACRYGNVQFSESVFPLKVDPSPMLSYGQDTTLADEDDLLGDEVSTADSRVTKQDNVLNAIGTDTLSDYSTSSEGATIPHSDSEGVLSDTQPTAASSESVGSEGVNSEGFQSENTVTDKSCQEGDITKSNGDNVQKNDSKLYSVAEVQHWLDNSDVKYTCLDSEYSPFTGYTMYHHSGKMFRIQHNDLQNANSNLITQTVAMMGNIGINHWKYKLEKKYVTWTSAATGSEKFSSTRDMVNRIKVRERKTTAGITYAEKLLIPEIDKCEGASCTFLTKEDIYLQHRAAFTVISGNDCAGNSLGIETPKSRKKAMAGPQAELWRKGEIEEATSLIESGTFEVVLWEKWMNVLGSLWVYKLKKDASGKIVRYKVRLVILGNHQKEGIDYNETFAAVMTHTTLRLLIALAAHLGWEVSAADVDTAFLNSFLKEQVYMWPPEGFKRVDDQNRLIVYRLIKSLYGLKQAPAAWAQNLTSWLISIGFEQCVVEPCLYILKLTESGKPWSTRTETDTGMVLIVGCYVDDIVMLSSKPKIREMFMKQFQTKYKVKDLGRLEWCLGMQVVHTKEGIQVNQTQYIKDLIHKFDLDESKLTNVPMSTLLKPLLISGPDPGTLEHVECQRLKYRELVGSLLYCLLTRPDVGFAVSALAQHMQNWSLQHYKAATRVLRYLAGTKHLGIVYKQGKANEMPILRACSDAEYGGQTKEGHSITGWVVFLGTSVIAAKSKKQPVIALSTAESEYIALAAVAQEVMFLRNVLSFLGLKQNEPTPVCVDNRACKLIAEGETTIRGVKHINIKYHFVKEAIKHGHIILLHVGTEHLPADLMTKPLGQVAYERHRNAILGKSASWLDEAKSKV